jgi:hypothetical protein
MIQFGFHKTENAWHFFSKQKETSVPGYVDKVTFFLLLFKFKTRTCSSCFKFEAVVEQKE